MIKPGYLKYKTGQYLRSFALEKRWAGQADYTRFIILGRSRVGSNLLRGLLNDHSQIMVMGELFQNKNEIGWAMEGFPGDGRTTAMFLQQPVRFLERKMWRNYPQGITAVGFKIFYYHARDDAWAPVWPYLQADTALRVIHIKRRNVLKTHLSRQLALASDKWVKTAVAGPKPANGSLNQPITLNYEDCLADFENTRTWEKEADAFFADHPIIDLFYEDFAQDLAGQMKRMQTFLGVDYEDVRPQTEKQRRRPLRQTIANFDELKAQFADSPWSPFFDETA